MRLSLNTPLEELFSGGRICSRSRVYMVCWKVCILCTQLYIIHTTVGGWLAAAPSGHRTSG